MSCASGNDTESLHFYAPKNRKRGYNLRLGTVWDNPRLDYTQNGAVPIRFAHPEEGVTVVQAWDYTDRCYRSPKQYTKQQSRVLHKAISGCQVAFSKKERLVFMTFTSQYEQKGYYDRERKERIVTSQEEADFNYKSKLNALLIADRHLMKNWDKIKDYIETQMQIDRFAEWLWKTHKLDYFNKKAYDAPTRKEIRKLKKENLWRFKYRMKYHLIRTAEGGGVLHTLIRKPFYYPAFPIQKIKQKWCEINRGSFEVTVKDISYDSEKPFEENSEVKQKAFYMAGYYTYQPIVRQASSHNWIFLGANQCWTRGKVTLGIKKYNIALVSETRYDYEKKDPDNDYIVGHTTKKVKTPNIIAKRESLIETYSVKSGKTNRDTCKLLADPELPDPGAVHVYEFDYPEHSGVKWYREFKLPGVVQRKPLLINALHVWKELLKDPPPSSYQTHLATGRKKETSLGVFPNLNEFANYLLRRKGIPIHAIKSGKSLQKSNLKFNTYRGGVEWLYL